MFNIRLLLLLGDLITDIYIYIYIYLFVLDQNLVLMPFNQKFFIIFSMIKSLEN